MRALLLVGILSVGALALTGCGSGKIEEAKNPVTWDPARDGDGMEVVGPGAKGKGPKAGMKPGGGGGAAPAK